MGELLTEVVCILPVFVSEQSHTDHAFLRVRLSSSLKN